MADETLETITDPAWGYTYIPALDVSYIRNDDGSYSVWVCEMELHEDGDPEWEPFITFGGSYDKSVLETIKELVDIEINKNGKWW